MPLSPGAPGPVGRLPLLAAVEMGYGHLRPAAALAAVLGVPVERADLPPLAGPVEARAWEAARALYHGTSRRSQDPRFGAPFLAALEAMSAIRGSPDEPQPDPDAGTRAVALSIARGLGAGLVARLRETGAPLLTTFYLPALAAAAAGLPAWCVVTDTDCARAWARPRAADGGVRYCAPTERVARRLRSYGVPGADVLLTGFPLAPSLADPEPAERNFAARVRRLRGGPARVLFSIGGAGAQAAMVRAALPALAPLVREGRLALRFAIGTHHHLRAELTAAAAAEGVEVDFVSAERAEAYPAPFDAALADTDLVWTKPSEMVFYAGLGLPLLLAPPIGVHERLNEAWLLGLGGGVGVPDASGLGALVAAGLDDGRFVELAEAGWVRVPRDGARRVAALVCGG